MPEESLCQEMKGEGTPRQRELHQQMLEGMEMHAGLGGQTGQSISRELAAGQEKPSRILLTGEQGCDSLGVSRQAGHGQIG